MTQHFQIKQPHRPVEHHMVVTTYVLFVYLHRPRFASLFSKQSHFNRTNEKGIDQHDFFYCFTNTEDHKKCIYGFNQTYHYTSKPQAYTNDRKAQFRQIYVGVYDQCGVDLYLTFTGERGRWQGLAVGLAFVHMYLLVDLRENESRKSHRAQFTHTYKSSNKHIKNRRGYY